jgi:hypothetical protein
MALEAGGVLVGDGPKIDSNVEPSGHSLILCISLQPFEPRAPVWHFA